MSAEDHLVPDIYRQVAGFKQVTDFFGYWPSFHDSEILSLWLEHAGRPEQYEGPVACMKLYTNEWRHDPVSGETTASERAVVEFRFTSVEAFHLVGFECQNAIYSLELRVVPDERFPGRLHVSFQPGSGVAGSFECKVEVVDVAPVSSPDPYFPAMP